MELEELNKALLGKEIYVNDTWYGSEKITVGKIIDCDNAIRLINVMPQTDEITYREIYISKNDVKELIEKKTIEKKTEIDNCTVKKIYKILPTPKEEIETNIRKAKEEISKQKKKIKIWEELLNNCN